MKSSNLSIHCFEEVIEWTEQRFEYRVRESEKQYTMERKEEKMKRKILCCGLAVVFFVSSYGVSGAMDYSRDILGDGTVVSHFCFSSAESERIIQEFGYNWVVADRIVKTLFREANIPSTFTGKAGVAGALGFALSSTAYCVWDLARRNGPDRCWCLTYRTRPHQLKLIDRTLGKIGDKILPFGEGAGIIIEAINEILNTVAASR